MQTFTGAEYLLIDAANHYGLDKELYSVRIEWARKNLNKLEQLADTADSPHMFTKTVDAIRKAQQGIPTGHLVEFDAVASGIQILSVTARCEVGMKNTGVINSGIRPDPYTKCTEIMDRHEYLRKVVKDALMTFFYGSEMRPKLAFGEGEDLALFFEAAKAVAPEAYELRHIFINAWQPLATFHEWVMPDAGVVHKRVWNTKDYKIQEPLLGSSFTFRTKVNEGKEKGVALAADVTHSLDGYLLRELCRRCNFDTMNLETVRDMITTRGELEVTDRTKLISLVEIDSILKEGIEGYSDNDLGILLEQINLCLDLGTFEIVTIHDAFKCHPNHMNKLRMHYNRILWEMYHSEIMPDIYHQITGDNMTINPVDPKVAEMILDADYPIC